MLCIQNHLEHKRHVPECVQNILRAAVKSLADQMELETTDLRPSPEFWSTLDREDFLKKSLGRHESAEESNH